MITKRDVKVIDFIKKFKYATTDTISELFYPNVKIAQRRLKIITEDKLIKRDRDHFTAQYYYYIEKSKQARHHLLLTDFYRELNKIAEIVMFEKEFKCEDIIADGLVVYKINKQPCIAFVEVEISNKGLDLEKYESLFKSNKYKKYFPVFPFIIVIGNRAIPKTTLKIIQVNEDIENLKELLK